MVKLYDKFDHWQNDGNIWIYSDPHFADDEMKWLRADYIGDDEQVKRINSKVGKNDTLIILGDVGDASFVKKLRGYKVLVMGNHDSGASNYKRVEEFFTAEEVEGKDIGHARKVNLMGQDFYYTDNRLFDEVYEGPLFISEKILLSHEPIDFPFALNIHGHDHSNWHSKDINHINVCAEHIDYTPISLNTIVKSGVLKKIDSIHRMTIDNAVERKAKRNNYEVTWVNYDN